MLGTTFQKGALISKAIIAGYARKHLEIPLNWLYTQKMQKFLKTSVLLLIFLNLLLIFHLFKYYSNTRSVDTTRMERCLEIYADYRKNQDQDFLTTELEKINLTPKDFQIIIDKFIYYRVRKSSHEQSMKLLKAFKLGLDINIESIEIQPSIPGIPDIPFALDAEILSVFEKNPELLKKAFEG